MACLRWPVEEDFEFVAMTPARRREFFEFMTASLPSLSADVDNVAVYNTALSAQRIAAHYAAR